jgi:hypothetical protein
MIIQSLILSSLCLGQATIDLDYTPHEEPPIAYFDVVPQQDIEGIFNMGVVAYHLEGIDRVEYTIHRDGFVGDWNRDGTVNGEDLGILFDNWGNGVDGEDLGRMFSAWGHSIPHEPEVVTVTEQEINPRTGQEEYWFGLDTRNRPDSVITVTAEIFPIDGPSLVLDKSWQEDSYYGGDGRKYTAPQLFSNNTGQFPTRELYISPNGSNEFGDGTRENPYQKLNFALRSGKEMPWAEVGGTTIYLMEGDHTVDQTSWPNNAYRQNGRYIIIRSDPQADQNLCRIVGVDDYTSSSRILYSQWVKFQDIVIETEQDNILSRAGNAITWFDGVSLFGTPEEYAIRPQRNATGVSTSYHTNGFYRFHYGGPGGLIVRNVAYDYIYCDVISGHGTQLVLDVTISNHGPIFGYEDGCHEDFMQYNYLTDTEVGNQIIRNVYAVGQCKQQGIFSNPGAELGSRLDNVWFENVVMSNQFELEEGQGCNPYVFTWTGPSRNLMFKDCVFHGGSRLGYDNNPEGPWTTNPFDGLPRYKNVKVENCFRDFDKTLPFFPTPDRAASWAWGGPDELQWDWDKNDDLLPNPFGPDDPWFSQITGFLYVQTE